MLGVSLVEAAKGNNDAKLLQGALQRKKGGRVYCTSFLQDAATLFDIATTSRDLHLWLGVLGDEGQELLMDFILLVKQTNAASRFLITDIPGNKTILVSVFHEEPDTYRVTLSVAN